jgi:hypothetical protein
MRSRLRTSIVLCCALVLTAGLPITASATDAVAAGLVSGLAWRGN